MTPDSVECRRPTEFGRQTGLRWTLLLIVALIAVKAPALFRLGLWRDEAATYLYATAPTPGAFLDLIGHVEANPPGFFYLMYQWVHAFGSAPFVMKLPAFAFSLVLIWLTYELGRKLHSPRIGLCATLLLAAAPVSTFISLEARAYTLAACLCTLIILVYERACEKPTLRNLLLLALAAAAALYVHYTAIPFLAAIGIITAARPKLVQATRLRIVLTLAASALPFAAWMPSFLAQTRAGMSFQSFQAPLTAMDMARLFLNDIVSLLPDPPAVGIAIICLLASFVLIRVRAGRSPGVPMHALAIGVLSTAFLALLDWHQKWYICPFAPLLIVCGTAYAAEATSCLFSSSRRLNFVTGRWLLPLATALVVVLGAPENARLLHGPLSGMSAAVADARKTTESTFYVLAPDYLASIFMYYERSTDAPPLRFDAFPRQDRPEFFRFFDGYAKLWQSPNVVDRSEKRYLRDATGFRFLAFVVHRDLHQKDPAPRTKVDVLFDVIRLHLKEVDHREYPGTVEPLVVYRFRLPNPVARQPAVPSRALLRAVLSPLDGKGRRSRERSLATGPSAREYMSRPAASNARSPSI
jgi:hypothetical protein